VGVILFVNPDVGGVELGASNVGAVLVQPGETKIMENVNNGLYLHLDPLYM
jgi:hypothetical protein